MKKIFLITSFAMLLLTGCGEQATQQQLLFSDNLEDEIKEIYKYDGITVYSKFFNIDYKDSNTDAISLSKALKKNKITVDQIIERADGTDALNDGGTMIYEYHADKNEITDTDFVIIKCNRFGAGVKKIIISPEVSLSDQC